MECMWRREIQRRLFHVQTLYQWLRAGCEPVASGSIPVRHHPDHRGLYRCHDRYAAGSPGIGVVLGGPGRSQGWLLEPAVLRHADGPCAGAGLRHGLRQGVQEGAGSDCHLGSRQKERNPGYHLRVHHLLLAQLGLWPDCRRPAGQGCGPPGTGCGLSPADCLRLFRLCDLARRPVGVHPSANWRHGLRGAWSCIPGPGYCHDISPDEPGHGTCHPGAHALRQLCHASGYRPYHCGGSSLTGGRGGEDLYHEYPGGEN